MLHSTLTAFEVDAFSNSEQALKYFRAFAMCDGLIIIDIRMLRLIAFEFAKEIHKDSLDIPARFMTVCEIDSVEYKEIFQAVDPSEFVSKLMSLRKLVEVVTKYIRNS